MKTNFGSTRLRICQTSVASVTGNVLIHCPMKKYLATKLYKLHILNDMTEKSISSGIFKAHAYKQHGANQAKTVHQTPKHPEK